MAEAWTWVFPTESQLLFARLSGDWNPSHVDVVAARRTQAGVPIVHGLHTVLRCLDCFAQSAGRPRSLRGLRVKFLKPITPADPVQITLTTSKSGDPCLRVNVRDATAATVQLLCSDEGGTTAINVETVPTEAEEAVPGAPRLLALEELRDRAGSVPVQGTLIGFANLFPHAAAWLGARRLQELAALSQIVGMECPGRYSLFSGFAIQLASSSDRTARVAYRVESCDERFRLVRMSVDGAGITGHLDAFAPAPVRQVSVQECAQVVRRDEFEGQVILIVGGSRGLGEVTAKIIAAGGGHPIVTYAVGAAEAAAVASEIVGFGGRCDVLQYDARRPAAPQLDSLTVAPRSLYYFATGPIFGREGPVFDGTRLHEFLALYVDGFHDLCCSLLSRSSGAFSAFYPSSVSIDVRPRHMTEYTMAKVAGEILCADLSAAHSRLSILVDRLPRIPTDQTVSMIEAESANALVTLLPLVRSVQARLQSPPSLSAGSSGPPR